MSIFYEDSSIKVYNKSCTNMSEIPDDSIHCIVTSPPYFGLRTYSGNQDLIWGGDKDCKHEWGELIKQIGHHSGETNPGKEGYTKDANQWSNEKGVFCIKCGAWQGQFGLEPNLELYIEHFVVICREIKRVLRKDGTFWLNLGDSYAGSGSPGGDYRNGKGGDDYLRPYNHNGKGLKPKDLMMIPHRIAIALQDDGWWVRSDIVWHKSNGMPESAEDRPTGTHEYIFLLTKSAHYYFDYIAIQEKAKYDGRKDTTIKPGGKYIDRNHLSNGTKAESFHVKEAERWVSEINGEPARNCRDVWEFPTESSPCKHFAVFPQELAERCIKSGTSDKGCCSKCGAPYKRIVSDFQTKHDGMINSKYDTKDKLNYSPARMALFRQHLREHGMENKPSSETTGWEPTCNCQAEIVPCVTLDPFSGSGTTAWVSKKLARKSIAYELSEEYCHLIVNRNRQQVLL